MRLSTGAAAAAAAALAAALAAAAVAAAAAAAVVFCSIPSRQTINKNKKKLFINDF